MREWGCGRLDAGQRHDDKRCSGGKRAERRGDPQYTIPRQDTVNERRGERRLAGQRGRVKLQSKGESARLQRSHHLYVLEY